MTPQILGQTFIGGLYAGGIYALFAVGLTLIYGVMYLINFAHGELLMLGMYTGFWAFTLLGIHPYIAVLLAALLLFALGAILERGLFQPVLDAPLLNQILLSLGISTALMGLAQFFFGAQPRSVILPFSSSSIRAFGLIFNLPRTISFLVALILCVSLYFFLRHHRIGKAIRACSQSRDAARLMGINVTRINMLTFGIGSALVGIAGAMLVPSFPVSPTIGQNFGISGFVVVVLGTMGNFIGAFIAGIIIGLAETFGGLFIGSQLKQVVSMAIFILILLFRPEGLFGGKTE